MLKKLPLRQLALLLFAALSFQTASTQTFWTEDFGSVAKFSAWTSANVGSGTQQWERSTNPALNIGFQTAPKAFTAPTAANGYALFNSDANGENAHVATLTSAPINCASQTSVRVRFHSQYAPFSTDALAEVRVSSDGGANWTAYPVLESVPGFPFEAGAFVAQDIVSEVSLPAANGKAAVLLQFRWTGEYEYGWKIDDVEMLNYVAPKADVTFKVNLALVTPSPEGARLAGTFNNWTDDLMTNEGNGVWSITKSISVGDTIRYKFKNGSGSWEAGQAACGVNDGSGGFNRQFEVKGTITLPTVCFNACGECVVPCAANPANSIICDNIDTYVTTKKLGPQATHWTTWSGTEGTTEDGIVATEQAASAPNSVKIVSTVAAGGPQDVVLNLGNKSTGRYSLKWKFFIPAAKKAYYNIQEVVPIPATPPTGNWNLDVFFEADGKARGAVEGTNKFAFTFPYAKWFTIEHIVDMDNNILTYLVDGKIVGKIAYPDKLGGIDFYGIDNTHQFYLDDVEYVTLPALVSNADICDKAVDLSLYFGQAAGVTQTTPSYDNTTATASPYDPAIDCWAEDVNAAGDDIVDNSLWFTFIGDGNRYHIETDSCSPKFITGGDTQMAIFEGPDCLNLTLSECNDDIADDDFRSAIDIETEAGKAYYILVDGYNFAGNISKGDFCLKITQTPSVSCADGEVGTYEFSNPASAICFGTNITDILEPDVASFIIPNQGPRFGMAWCISTQALDPTQWPGLNTSISFTRLLPNVFEIFLLNDGNANNPQPGVYFLTPVVAGGADLIDPNGDTFLNNISVDNGCFFVGESQPFLLLPELPDLSATASITKETVPPGNNGKIDLSPEGGFPDPTVANDPSLYIFNWSNTATTEDLSGLAAGTYTVTISDPTGCVSPVSLTFVVDKTNGTEDPASVKQLNISPNPTTGAAQLNLTLANAAEVRIEVVNTLGQVLQTLNEGNVSTLSKALDLSSLNAGTYMLRVAVDGETAVRRIVVQK